MRKYRQQGETLRRVCIWLDNHPDFGAFTIPHLAKKMRLPTGKVFKTINNMIMLGYVDTRPSKRAIHKPLVVRFNEDGQRAAKTFRRSARRNGNLPALDAISLMETMMQKRDALHKSWEDVPVDQS